MEGRGHQVEPPRTGLPKNTPTRFDVVLWVAFGVSTVLVIGQIGFILSFTPVVLAMAEKTGNALPAMLAIAHSLGPIGMFLILAIGDALVFALFAWLARRYYIGLVFIPSILYLAGAFGALWVFAVEVAAATR